MSWAVLPFMHAHEATLFPIGSPNVHCKAVSGAEMLLHLQQAPSPTASHASSVSSPLPAPGFARRALASGAAPASPASSVKGTAAGAMEHSNGGSASPAGGSHNAPRSWTPGRSPARRERSGSLTSRRHPQPQADSKSEEAMWPVSAPQSGADAGNAGAATQADNQLVVQAPAPAVEDGFESADSDGAGGYVSAAESTGGSSAAAGSAISASAAASGARTAALAAEIAKLQRENEALRRSTQSAPGSAEVSSAKGSRQARKGSGRLRRAGSTGGATDTAADLDAFTAAAAAENAALTASLAEADAKRRVKHWLKLDPSCGLRTESTMLLVSLERSSMLLIAPHQPACAPIGLQLGVERIRCCLTPRSPGCQPRSVVMHHKICASCRATIVISVTSPCAGCSGGFGRCWPCRVARAAAGGTGRGGRRRRPPAGGPFR